MSEYDLRLRGDDGDAIAVVTVTGFGGEGERAATRAVKLLADEFDVTAEWQAEIAAGGGVADGK